MSHIITLDVGTTSIKTGIFSEALTPVAFVSQEYALLTPAPDIVELDPEIYWNAAVRSIRDVIAKAGVDGGSVAAIVCTTQGETMIPVDANGGVLHNAVVWIDARAHEQAKQVRAAIGNDAFYRATGQVEIGPAIPVCKVLWFKQQRPDIFAKTAKFLLLEDFLLHRLIGRFVTHPSLQTSTGWYEINQDHLWNEALTRLGISQSLFPETVPCGSVAGTVRPPVASQLGVHSSTRVIAGAMDQVCSAIGAGNVAPGMVTETTGTALVICATLDKPDYDNPLRLTYYRHYDRRFLLLPYCTTAGIVFKWFKDEFCAPEIEQAKAEGVSVYDLLTGLAANAPPGCSGLVAVPHFAGKFSPDANPAARGVFFGLGLDTKKAHLVRAILESIGYMLRENVEAIEKVGVPVKTITSLGGGSQSRLWNSIKADICNRDIRTMRQTESTSLGAAILAATGIGLYTSVPDACGRACEARDVHHPDPQNRQAYEKGYRTYLDIDRRLKTAFNGQG